MKFFTFISLIIVLCLGLWFLSAYDNKERIHRKVESINGEVVDIDFRPLSKGPFWYAGSSSQVYRFIYTQDGEEKIGWVKFGVIARYKFDCKK